MRLAWMALAAVLLGQEDPAAGLKHSDPRVRASAARALGALGGAEAVKVLEAALEDEDANVREAAAAALATLEVSSAKAIDVLTRALRSEEWYPRWRACLALKRLGSDAKAAVPALVDVLKTDTRREAALALGEIAPRDPKARVALALALSEAVPGEHRAILSALAGAGPDAAPAAAWLIREMATKRHRLARPAAMVLGGIGVLPVPAFKELMADEDVRVGKQALRAVTEHGIAHGAWVLLVAALRDDELSSLARQALDRADISRAARDLVPMLRDEDGRVRAYAAWAMRKVGVTAVPVLVEALEDEDKDVRLSAARALGSLGPEAKAAVPALERRLDDSDKDVRSLAVDALGWIATKEAVSALDKALRDAHGTVAWLAAEALGRIGEPAREAIPALIRAMRRPGDAHRGVVEKALARVGGGAVVRLVDAWEEKKKLRARWHQVGGQDYLDTTCTELLQLLRDEQIGEPTLGALRELKLADLMPFARRMLTGGKERSRECACLLLGELSEEKKRARQLLLGARRDRSEKVRTAAAAALQALEKRARRDRER